MLVNAKKLKQVLDAACEVADRGDRPIVSYLLLFSDGDGILTVSATNYSVDLSAWVEADGPALRCMVNALAIKRVVALAPDDGSVFLSATANGLEISYDGSEFVLPVTDPESFPERLPDASDVMFPASPELIYAIANAVQFAGKDSSRPGICGVWIDGSVVFATDGHRLAYTEVEISDGKLGEIMIQTDAAMAIVANARRFGVNGAKIGLFRGYDSFRCSFGVGPVTIASRSSEYGMANWRCVVDQDWKKPNVELEIAPFVDRIRRALAISATERVDSMRLDVSGGHVDITTKTIVTPAKSRAAVQGLDFGFAGRVTLNPQYLLHALQLVGDGKVSMCIGGTMSPMALQFSEQPKFRVVLMPMREQ